MNRFVYVIPPLLALSVSIYLITNRSLESSELKQQSEELTRKIKVVRSSESINQDINQRTVKQTFIAELNEKKEIIDWGEIVLLKNNMKGSESISDFRKMLAFENRLSEMSKDELIDALDEIALLDISDEERLGLMMTILEPLALKDPELALHRFSDYIAGDDRMMVRELSRVLGMWAKKDPLAASSWLNQQIEAGVFITKSIDPNSDILQRYESNIFSSLLVSDLNIAEQRITAMSEEKRKYILQEGVRQLDELAQASYATLARKYLSKKDALDSIGYRALSMVIQHDFPSVDAYMDRIAASEEEKTVIAQNAALGLVKREALDGKTISLKKLEGIEKMRDWIGSISPESVASSTGEALGYTSYLEPESLDFPEAVKIAQHYQEKTGNDDVIVGLMKYVDIRKYETEAFALAETISDPGLRAQTIDSLLETKRRFEKFK